MSSRAPRLLNRILLVAIFGAIGWLVLAIPTRSPPGEQMATAPSAGSPAAPSGMPVTPSAFAPGGPSGAGLALPVAGVLPGGLIDTFTQARGDGRPHDAIDIMAARGTPVLAAAEGRVEKLHFSNGGGGITAYVRSPDGAWVYYYAHLDRYAPGLAEGRQLRRGDLIGFVGSTGNASPDGPHLHFAIKAMASGQRWWEGIPVNPYPLLTGSGGSGQP